MGKDTKATPTLLSPDRLKEIRSMVKSDCHCDTCQSITELLYSYTGLVADYGLLRAKMMTLVDVAQEASADRQSYDFKPRAGFAASDGIKLLYAIANGATVGESRKDGESLVESLERAHKATRDLKEINDRLDALLIRIRS